MNIFDECLEKIDFSKIFNFGDVTLERKDQNILDLFKEGEIYFSPNNNSTSQVPYYPDRILFCSEDIEVKNYKKLIDFTVLGSSLVYSQFLVNNFE